MLIKDIQLLHQDNEVCIGDFFFFPFSKGKKKLEIEYGHEIHVHISSVITHQRCGEVEAFTMNFFKSKEAVSLKT